MCPIIWLEGNSRENFGILHYKIWNFLHFRGQQVVNRPLTWAHDGLEKGFALWRIFGPFVLATWGLDSQMRGWRAASASPAPEVAHVFEIQEKGVSG